ncbi:CehA/McbA family metallohydrolase [Variovorax ureilyticus]|uniref:CehA/McbA family metallohydrolase n=1 Tax=Variovorax ureilyticus TaxID=1836198 RepID=A0ABU8VPY7_9BURK
MKTPPSSHFTPIDLRPHFNARRDELQGGLGRKAGVAEWITQLQGLQTFRGIPFLLGGATGSDVLALRPGEAPLSIPLAPAKATYVVFLHVVTDHARVMPRGFGGFGPPTHPVDGNELGTPVATYSLRYADGSEAQVPVLRRLAIQQRHIAWSASPFEAVPALGPHVNSTHGEDLALDRAPTMSFGFAECRAASGRLRPGGENLWLYALPNPHPSKEITGIQLRAEEEAALVYAVSTTRLAEHPLRLQVRRKLRLRLPPGVELNRLGELDVDDRGDQIGMDLGTVISARAVLEYSQDEWLGDANDVQPVRSRSEVLVEYAAHPDAKLYLRGRDGSLHMHDLRALAADKAADEPPPAMSIAPTTRPVKFRILEKETGQGVAARLHCHGPAGEYLAPRGHHRKVNTGFFEDLFGDFANGLNQYAYVDGTCIVDLPLGLVFVEIRRGFEVRPIRRVVHIDANTESLTFELEKVIRWREQGWVSSDTHVHFLNPQLALLEGKAEDVNVVNLLASQWGELFTNVSEFDGRTTLGAKDFGGDGEFLVRVGTENRMQVLGHLSLLGYDGEMIHPLCTGGPDESAIGDPLETTMSEWAERCRRQGGLVVLPHAPMPQAERAADIVLGVIDAMEMMTFNPRDAQITAFGLADWYRFLNIGYHLPLVAGSDKMSAASLLGGVRTYSQLGEREFTFLNWMDSVRNGDTFITVGPLVSMTVEGRRPGSRIQLPAGGGTVTVDWRIESVSVPVKKIEVVCNGLVAFELSCDDLECKGSLPLRVTESCWVAIRLRGSVVGRDGDIAAHTSAVQVEVGDKPIFAAADAVSVLAQIEGTIAYVDTLAPRADEDKHAGLRANLALAHHRLHRRLHQLGAGHSHTPIHAVHTHRDH